jgi:sterol desaturase/sphingolipid hydroxylase (fatty acid hydroxylase superfamily)
MSEQMMDLDSIEGEEKPVKQAITASDIFWMSVQPVLVLGSIILVATMVASEWANHKLYAVIMIMLPIPVLLIAERFLAKRRDWLLKPAELWEDAFWYGMGIFLWGPIVSGYYSTPISEGFRAIRDRSPLDITVAPETVTGLVLGALLIRVLSGFPYYWLHRVQHESRLFWRLHATHHHITKMSCMRGARTHPLEHFTFFVRRYFSCAVRCKR